MRPLIDKGNTVDWGATSQDYALFRHGPPEEFYRRIQVFGIGLPEQRILDLGTGTGAVARALARQGAVVSGIDVSPEQIHEAKRVAATEGLRIDFRVAAAEEPPFAPASFDVATANQCFLYFDHERTTTALRRILRPGGRLVTSHINWLPTIDSIAHATEELICKFNPSWEGAAFDGKVVPVPEWVPSDVLLEGFFWFDADVEFDHHSWRGRIRASRGIGASLPPNEVQAFDREHAKLLATIAPEKFTVLHRVDARIFRFP